MSVRVYNWKGVYGINATIWSLIKLRLHLWFCIQYRLLRWILSQYNYRGTFFRYKSPNPTVSTFLSRPIITFSSLADTQYPWLLIIFLLAFNDRLTTELRALQCLYPKNTIVLLCPFSTPHRWWFVVHFSWLRFETWTTFTLFFACNVRQCIWIAGNGA